MAKGADLDIDDDLKDDIEQKLGGSKRAKYAENDTMRQKYEKKDAKDRKKSEDTATGDEEKEETEFSRFKTYDDDGSNRKRRNKEDQKKDAIRRKYQENLQKTEAKRYANSSYLTPESANYLN